MKVSDKGLAELISHEALVTSPYKDSVGVWTVGCGHTSGAGQPYPAAMTKGEARPVGELVDLFRRDLAKYEADVDKAVTVSLKQHEFDALVSFHFNTGAIARASFVKKLNAGDRAGAAKGMLDWNKPAEIIERRTKEMKLFRDGAYSNDGKASIYPASVNGAVLWSKGKRVEVASLIAPAPANTADAVPVEDLPKAPALPPDPPPAVIVRDEPIPAPGFWSRLLTAFVNRLKGAA